jgi:putative transmembrane protein PGPGW
MSGGTFGALSIVWGVVGGSVLALGIALIVLPGPAFLVIPACLAILAIEFAWAKRWLRKAREWLPGSGVRQQAPRGAIPALATTPPKIPSMGIERSIFRTSGAKKWSKEADK